MRFLVCALALALLFSLATAASIYKDELQNPTCGYQSCTKSDPDKINIHLVAHTHDDVGWLKTVDQYYFGGRMDIQAAGVQYIIDSVVDSLVKDPSRKFIYVETAFLWKWWLRQDEAKRQTVRSLINEGRLEIIGGGWSMNDEASTHYRSMLDQYTWGFRRLNDTFGECARPKIGWQIDPFGHSREQASMFTQLGFDGLLFGRLDYQDKNQRLKDKTAEFIWEASPNLGQSANLFTSVLYNAYAPPPGFCFDILCQDEPMIDDPNSPDYNIEEKVAQFLEYINKQSKYYRTNNLILTMGGDFTYLYAEMYFKNLDKLVHQFLNFSHTQASSYRTNNVILTMGEDFNYQYAEMYFANIDKLISAINKLNGTQYKAFYSTPSCYLKAVNEQNLTWTTKTDDFFPYSSDPHAFWTGYFTSRPTLKFFERMGNNLLQVVKQLSVLTGIADSQELQLFREAMGVMQHHDAVTGTEKQHVAEDYARILHHSMSNAQRLAADALRKWATKRTAGDEVPAAEFHSCLLLNISSCEHSSDHSSFVVTVYNPTSQPLNTYVRLPVSDSQYSVKDFSGKEIVTQVLPIPEQVAKLPGRSSKANKELIFQAVNVAPLGYQSFYVSAKSPSEQQAMQSDRPDQSFVQIGRQQYRVSVDANNDVMVKTPLGIEYVQSFHYYEGATGNNEVFANRSSGAYIFRPKNNYSKELPASGGFQIFKGPLVEEIHLVVNDWVSQVVRIYNDEEYVEFDWLVGPIPIDDKVGKELVVKYTSNLKSRDEFYTDSNGREMLRRQLNHRPTWKVQLEEEIAGNYYPVTAKISIEDKQSQHRLSVLNDRAQGGSSLKEGQLELMVHRRLLHDDAFGVDEALNETAYGHGLVARGQHLLIAGSTQNRDQVFLQEKELAVKLALRPWIFVTPFEDSFEKWTEHYNMRGEALIGAVPSNVHILTLEPWKDGAVLLRLEHLFELDESPNKYSLPAQVNINDLFPTFNVLSVLETTLGANQHAKQSQRLIWKAEKNEVPKVEDDKQPISGDTCTISLKPMQIRTFLVKLSPRSKHDA